MVDEGHRLQRASEEVAGQVVDGEAIVMNLGTGIYYSMNPVASRVWELSEEGYAVTDVVRAIAHEYSVDEARARADVIRIAEELVEEGLVVSVPADGARTWLGDSPAGSGEYVEPALEKYSDMAELLALDPPMPGVAESPWLESETSE